MRPRWTLTAILPIMLAPAFAFDDQHFCAAARQIAIAADKDVGIWIDRVTRNAGMIVACDKKVVEFTRFTYLPAASMTDQWKAAKAWDWNSLRCNSELWREAIDNGWSTVLNVVTADGGRATFKAQCR